MTAHTTTRRTAARPKMVLSVTRRPAHTVVELIGDLDATNTASLREGLAAVLNRGMRLLVLDLSAVRSCDAAGAALLVGTRRRAALLGVQLRLIAPNPRVARTLRVTGVDRGLTIHRTLSDALTSPFLRLPAAPPSAVPPEMRTASTGRPTARP